MSKVEFTLKAQTFSTRYHNAEFLLTLLSSKRLSLYNTVKMLLTQMFSMPKVFISLAAKRICHSSKGPTKGIYQSLRNILILLSLCSSKKKILVIKLWVSREDTGHYESFIKKMQLYDGHMFFSSFGMSLGTFKELLNLVLLKFLQYDFFINNLITINFFRNSIHLFFLINYLCYIRILSEQ